MASVANSESFAADNLGKETLSETHARPELSFNERFFNKTDQRNFAQVLLTRLITSGIAYAFTNREQDRVINEALKERGSQSYDKNMPAATALGRWIHDSLYKPVYWVNRKAADAVASIAGSFGGTEAEKKQNYDAAREFFYAPSNRNGSKGYDEGITIDEKVGRTLSGFFWGALANNAQNSIIKAVELGDSAPWVNKDGSIDASTAIKWGAQEVFRGVLKGAGEDVFASNSLYAGVGSWWIDRGKDTYKKLTGIDIDKEKTPKPFFLHAWEWVAKFWAYNVFTDWWRGIYDNCLGGIEKLIGGKRNNPEANKEEDDRSFLQKVVEAPYRVLRSVIRVPLKLLLPMPIATFFGFVIPGYYGAVQWGTKYGEDGSHEQFFKKYDKNGINPLDAMGKALGKGINQAGQAIDDRIKFDPKTGLDGIGVEGARAYSRYGGYFALKKYFLDKWAGPEVDEAMNQSIDGFFGAAFNVLTLNFKGAKKNIQKMKDGVRKYIDFIKYKNLLPPTNNEMPASPSQSAGATEIPEQLALEGKRKSVENVHEPVPNELAAESTKSKMSLQPALF